MWLFEIGRIEEAVLELDTLGDVKDVNDSLALFLIAEHSDMSGEQRNQIIEEAFEAAASEEKAVRGNVTGPIAPA